MVLIVTGLTVPQLLGNGIERLNPRDQALAREALAKDERLCLDHPFERLIAMRTQVESVEASEERSVVIRKFTVFGIPSGRMIISSTEALCVS